MALAGGQKCRLAVKMALAGVQGITLQINLIITRGDPQTEKHAAKAGGSWKYLADHCAANRIAAPAEVCAADHCLSLCIRRLSLCIHRLSLCIHRLSLYIRCLFLCIHRAFSLSMHCAFRFARPIGKTRPSSCRPSQPAVCRPIHGANVDCVPSEWPQSPRAVVNKAVCQPH